MVDGPLPAGRDRCTRRSRPLGAARCGRRCRRMHADAGVGRLSLPVISARNLSPLPGVDHLRRLLQSMAMLDAILSPEWEFRYYSFDSKWSPGEQMGSMRDGGGDDFFAHF